LSQRWVRRLEDQLVVDRREMFPSHQLFAHLPELIERVAAFLEDPEAQDSHAAEAMDWASALGEQRYEQRATVEQLLREYEALSDVVEGFLEEELAAYPSADSAVGAVAIQRAIDAITLPRQKTIVAFVARHADTIERQTEQLRKFSRLVSHEVRQPLAVLQVVAKTLPVNPGDVDSARMLDIFNRNVTRLVDVTGKLERLARITRATDRSTGEQLVNLSTMASQVAEQLADMAAARDVRVSVATNLPTLRLDPARVELVFINLLANAIKYSDAGKADRYVEVCNGESAGHSIIVRDNGVGIQARRLQDIFREFVRAHAQRHDEANSQALGLGLSIVRECMDAANGLVRIESREGKGTTVKLTWPSR
jgi:signal transduction histidine kinase